MYEMFSTNIVVTSRTLTVPQASPAGFQLIPFRVLIIEDGKDGGEVAEGESLNRRYESDH